MELEYLHKSYSEFVSHLSSSLEITDAQNITSKAIIELCITNIEEAYRGCQTKENTNDKNNLISLLQQCTEEVNRLDEDNDFIVRMNTISNVYFLLSYLKLLFNSKVPTIDPVAKIQLKKQYALEEIDDLGLLKDSYKFQNEVFSCTNKTLHPHYKVLENKITSVTKKFEEYGKHVAVRPNDLSYAFVIQVS